MSCDVTAGMSCEAPEFDLFWFFVLIIMLFVMLPFSIWLRSKLIFKGNEKDGN